MSYVNVINVQNVLYLRFTAVNQRNDVYEYYGYTTKCGKCFCGYI